MAGKNSKQRKQAASCYDHLGGILGEELFHFMQHNRWIVRNDTDTDYLITDEGFTGLEVLGIDIGKLRSTKRKILCRCIERHMGTIYEHTGAYLGTLLMERMLQLGWLIEKAEKQYEITRQGLEGLKNWGIDIKA